MGTETQQVNENATATNFRRLDVGCGHNKIEGSTYLDINPETNPDVVHNLNEFPYPFEENTFDEIYAKHIIEHLDDIHGFMRELHRILKPGGTLFIETPHFSSYVAYSEPEHTRFFSFLMFLNLVRPLTFEIEQLEITHFKLFRLLGIHWLANKFPRTYERFWTYMFPAENVKLLVRKK